MTSVLYVPPIVYTEIKSLVTNFIWNNGLPKIAYNTLINNKDNGGLGLIDLKTNTIALQINWIQRMYNDNDVKWTGALRYWIKDKDLNELLIGTNNKITIYNKFYENIINEWNKLKIIKDPTYEIIKLQYIWSNSQIQINKNVVKVKEWKQKGINFIQDLINDKGEIM